jgi:hypothetical protein
VGSFYSIVILPVKPVGRAGRRWRAAALFLVLWLWQVLWLGQQAGEVQPAGGDCSIVLSLSSDFVDTCIVQQSTEKLAWSYLRVHTSPACVAIPTGSP